MVNPENKINIVTFNYDTILARAVVQFSNSQMMQGKDYRDYVEIVHMHGECGELNEPVPSPQKTLCCMV